MTLHAVVRFVSDLVNPWHKKRARCFGLLVYALMRGQRLGVAQLGRNVPTKAKDKHSIKSVDRFLGNQKVDLHELWAELMALASASSKQLQVLLDWSDLRGDFEVLQAAVSFGGRSLPIAWVTARKGHYGRSRNIFESNFCRLLKTLVPPDVEWVIIADRGFGRASLMKVLHRAHIPFIIRIRRDVHVIHGRGRGALRHRKTIRGQIRDLDGALYGQDARFEGRCVLLHGHAAKEVWYLFTSLRDSDGWSASRVVRTYGKRMRIEESFRDHKSMRFGFQLRAVRLTKAERYDRLLGIAAVALLLLTCLGAYVEDRGLATGFKANTDARRAHSLFRLGLAFLGRLGLRRPPRRLLAWAFSTEL